MNIKNIQNITKVYGEQTKVSKGAKSQGVSPTQRPDEVILSSHAQEVSQHLRAIKNMPEVREAKVQEFSDKIATGQYKVDSRELAERIIAYSKNERCY
ncbi:MULTISPECIES: flagellar biosynthesis anti-sigma factor FlgM [Sporomusa]|jgi:negative regulator of flagellin synthesis FlgM|uniref:flagellar biosynthesis anti-sigma factor FlgM n=1 Tax=Sporomusa TaxID=2375 RepID=UPI0016683647|nr:MULTISPECIES: flagellar biosynthesis anti-sigma factor FlgM [Sporomusa]MCM0759683.1 flagellar biosynthesis anti-sigma factor FlgM [Sporomusa sphaeroides DSM 2875]HML34215.1 flagellar biosynthesis anti-sigma factor FlgM [Sporomusa sphaeroides]